jgi:hypothetical protein
MVKKRMKSGNLPAKTTPKDATPAKLLADLRELIESTRTGVAQAVNSALVTLYWQVGHRIRTEILGSKRATYGQEILSTLSKELVAGYGNGFSVPNLSRMMRLAKVFPDREIVASLSRQLGWSHFVEIISLKTDLQRGFYAEMCRIERWSVRTLREKVGGMLFERMALSRKPDELAREELAALRDKDRLTPDLIFRDPYFLDFLGLKDTYSEKDLEAATLREMEQFIVTAQKLSASFERMQSATRRVADPHVSFEGALLKPFCSLSCSPGRL